MKTRLWKLGWLLVLLGALAAGCGGGEGASRQAAAGQEGGRPETVRFAVSDVEGLEELQREFEPVQERLSETLGAEIEFYPVSSITAATTALESDRVDLVLAGPSEYVVMRERAGVIPVLGIHRPGYTASIVVRAGSGIETLQDLEGERIASDVPGGTSEHLGPAAMLSEAGLDPQEDVEFQFLGDLGMFQAFADEQVPAAAIGTGDYEPRMIEQFGVSPDEAPILAESPNLGPDAFVANPDTLPQGYIEEIDRRLDRDGDAILESIVGAGDTAYAENYADASITSVSDSDFDYMRKGYRAIGQDYGKLPGG